MVRRNSFVSELTARPRGLSPELRATFFYFTFFMTSGAAVTYGGIWLAEQGLSSGQIGIINAVPVFIMLVLNMVVGRIADRAPDWRQVIIIGALLGGVFPLGLFFVHDFVGILIVWTLWSLPVAAIGPVADAATIRMTRRNGSHFGTIRAWGTIGYMGVIFILGQILTLFGGVVFLPFFAAVALLRSGAALGLPNFRAVHHGTGTRIAPTGAKRLSEVMKPWFLLPLVGWSMIFGTHLLLNAFQSLLWKEQGIPESMIGILIALGALSEATMMFTFRRFAHRVPARRLILLSAVVAALRWIAMGFSPPIPWLIPLQLLHSVTFALGYLGCLNFIANWTSEDIAAEAQSFFQVLQQAMSVIALLTFGWLISFLGAHAFFASAGFAAVGAALIFGSMRMMPPKAVAA
jgi:PPP family 3-phenylpropionic acid transporter